MNKERPRGFNLIEAAIVLGVIGLVIGGIWVAASEVNKRNTANQIARDTMYFMQSCYNHISGRQSIGSGIGTIEAQRMGWIPQSWNVDQVLGYALNIYGIWPNDVVGVNCNQTVYAPPNDRYFALVELFDNIGGNRLDPRVCTLIATGLWNQLKRGFSNLHQDSGIMIYDINYIPSFLRLSDAAIDLTDLTNRCSIGAGVIYASIEF